MMPIGTSTLSRPVEQGMPPRQLDPHPCANTSTRVWRRGRHLVTVVVFASATALGVGVGLHGATVSPVAPTVAAAPADPVAAATTTGGDTATGPDRIHGVGGGPDGTGQGGRGGDAGGRGDGGGGGR